MEEILRHKVESNLTSLGFRV
jgi:hypothetical protein